VAAQRPSALQVAASIAGLTVVIVGGVLGWVTRPLGALAMCGGAALYLLCNGRYISGQAVSARTKMRRVLPPGIARLFVPSDDEARLGGLLAAAFIDRRPTEEATAPLPGRGDLVDLRADGNAVDDRGLLPGRTLTSWFPTRRPMTYGGSGPGM